MEKLPHFIDMAMSPKEQKEMYASPAGPDADAPIYPYGLCISLTQEELDKLDMDDDVNVGDFFHGRFMAEVRSVSENQTTSGASKCVSLQIVAMSAEDQEDEGEEAEEPYKPGRRNPYK